MSRSDDYFSGLLEVTSVANLGELADQILKFLDRLWCAFASLQWLSEFATFNESALTIDPNNHFLWAFALVDQFLQPCQRALNRCR